MPTSWIEKFNRIFLHFELKTPNHASRFLTIIEQPLVYNCHLPKPILYNLSRCIEFNNKNS
jgi:hypothetical protein